MNLCVYAHTHTQWTWGNPCEPKGRDEALGGPEESRWNHSCIRICVHSTHVYIHAVRRDEIWTNSFFLNTFFLWEK